MRKTSYRKIAVLLLFVFMFSMVAGCGTEQENTEVEQDTRTVTNLDGSEIVVPTEVNRVAALFGPSYEKVVLLGAEDKIVANGDFHIDGWPWSNVIYERLDEVPGVPNAHESLNIEEILKLKPDVVFYWDNPAEVQRLQEANIAVVPAVSSAQGQKFEDCKNMLMVYAQVLGKEEEKIAQEYCQYFDEKVDMITSVTKDIPEDQKPSVYFAVQKLLWSAGKESDIPEVIDLAGGKCVHANMPGGSKSEVNMEQMLKWDPEYIFVDHAGSSGNASAEEVVSEMSEDARYKQLSAVQNEQVKVCPTGVFFWDAGQQKVLLLMWMAKTLHPDLFEDLDMQAELKYFYKKFYRYDLTDEEVEKILLHMPPLGQADKPAA